MIKIVKDRETKQQHISMTRGDTAYLDWEITDGDNNIILLGENDRVKCTVREAPETDSPITETVTVGWLRRSYPGMSGAETGTDSLTGMWTMLLRRVSPRSSAQITCTSASVGSRR